MKAWASLLASPPPSATLRETFPRSREAFTSVSPSLPSPRYDIAVLPGPRELPAPVATLAPTIFVLGVRPRSTGKKGRQMRK